MFVTLRLCKNVNITLYYKTLLDYDSEPVLRYFAKSVYSYDTGNLISSRGLTQPEIHNQRHPS